MKQDARSGFGHRTHPLVKPTLTRILMLLTLTSATLATKAQSPYDTPVGRWRTFSDVTGKENGGVEIVNRGGELLGRLIAGHSTDFATKRCDKCPGERHNQPMKGLLILSGVHRNGDEWSGGEILDPDIGKVYRVKLKLADGGKKLLVRGYVGFALLGRTQTWVRME